MHRERGTDRQTKKGGREKGASRKRQTETLTERWDGRKWVEKERDR